VAVATNATANSDADDDDQKRPIRSPLNRGLRQKLIGQTKRGIGNFVAVPRTR